jgi:class 3 adenylate cyclase
VQARGRSSTKASSYGGVGVDTQGDGLFVAFATAPAALAAAREASERSLSACAARIALQPLDSERLV